MRPLDRRAGHLGEALEFFAEMKPARVRPTVVTFTTLIAAYSEAGDLAQQPHRCGINPPPTAMPHGHRANPDPDLDAGIRHNPSPTDLSKHFGQLFWWFRRRGVELIRIQ